MNVLDISVADDGSGPVLVLAGEIDLTTTSRLAAAVDRCLRDQPMRMTVDLHAVTFCDVAGGHVLGHAQQRAAAAGVGFRLTGLTAPVRRTLTLLQATSLLRATDADADHTHQVWSG